MTKVPPASVATAFYSMHLNALPHVFLPPQASTSTLSSDTPSTECSWAIPSGLVTTRLHPTVLRLRRQKPLLSARPLSPKPKPARFHVHSPQAEPSHQIQPRHSSLLNLLIESYSQSPPLFFDVGVLLRLTLNACQTVTTRGRLLVSIPLMAPQHHE